MTMTRGRHVVMGVVAVLCVSLRAPGNDRTYVLTATWNIETGNPAVVEGRPLWELNQVWPDRPGEAANYRLMQWRSSEWHGPAASHGRDPWAALHEGVLTLGARGAWPDKPGQKLPALAFIAPHDGRYALSGTVEVQTREGGGPQTLTVRQFDAAGGAMQVLKTFRFAADDPPSVALEGVTADLRAGDRLVIGPERLMPNNAVTVRLIGLRVTAISTAAAAEAMGRDGLPSATVQPPTPTVPSLDVRVPGEDVVFPDGARVVSVRDFGAKGDGRSDDTAAIQNALSAWPKPSLIYVPDGTYLISDTLRWGEGKGKGSEFKRQVLQGQSRDRTILRLKDACPGFTNADAPKPMIWTGQRPAQRFRNGLRNLTLDTGQGNPGAIGVQFIANNQGGIRHVTIRSGDGRGPIGLDLGYTDEQGPCLIAHLLVEGFDTGIRTAHAVDSVTFEDIVLRNQRVVGFLNDGQCVSVRQLRSVNAVPAYRNAWGPSLTAMVDCDLHGVGPASNLPAIINEAGLFARGIRTAGYASAIRNVAGTKRQVEGPDVDEFVSHEVLHLFPSSRRSLHLPVVETPVVGWDRPEHWVCVTNFGPPRTVTLVRRGDGKKETRTDWSVALQNAIDAGASTVYFPAGGDFGLYGPVRLRGRLRRLIGCESTMSRVVDNNEKVTMYQADLRPVFILEEGDAPVVVVERFDSWYASPRFEQRSRRTLVVSSLSFYDLETQPGTGDVFLEDVRGKQVTVRRSSLWGRQVNLEGWEEPRILNDGGQVWILGLKTENDPTVLSGIHGSRSEVLGGFIYANKDQWPRKQMFLCRDSDLSFTVGEWVTRRNAPFDIIEETQGGETRRLLKGQAYPRGTGSMIPLYVSGTRDRS